MDINALTKIQLETLLLFLKDTINYENLSHYEGYVIKNLFLAYMKLQNEEDKWREAMAYTE